jgi:uncharacterized membrane protein
MDPWAFIKEYYIDSIVYKEGYNIFNTITWAVILIFAVILIYRFLEKRIEIDEKFVYSNIPYIVFGSSLRVAEDAGFLEPPISYLFMTPFIYLLIFCIAFPTLLLSIRKFGKDYYKTYALIGTISALAILLLLVFNLDIVNGWVIPSGIALSLVATTLFYGVALFERRMRNKLSYLVLFSHMLDGFETYFGINFLGYWELHVLPRFLIEKFGAVSLPVAKFGVFLCILYLVDTSDESERLKNFVKFVLVVLGLAPGLRDGIRMMFNV